MDKNPFVTSDSLNTDTAVSSLAGDIPEWLTLGLLRNPIPDLWDEQMALYFTQPPKPKQ